MASIKVVVKDKVYKDGTIPVFIRVIHERKAYFHQIVRIEKRFFDPAKQRVKNSHPRHVEYNQLISEKVSEIESRLLDTQRKGASIVGEIENMFQKKQEDSLALLTFFETYIQKKRAKVAGNSKIIYQYILKDLENFLSKEKATKIALEDFSEDDLLDYCRYCKDVKKNKPRTISNKVRFVLEVYNHASDPKIGAIPKNPFSHFASSSGKSGVKTKLTIDEILKIENLELTQKSLILSRDVFLLQFYLYGTRISNILKLKPSNIVDGKVEYIAAKGGKIRTIKLRERSKEIVDKYLCLGGEYLFPILTVNLDDPRYNVSENELRLYKEIKNATKKINRSLDTIAKMCDINKRITSHVSRHSFASHAATKTKNIRAISQALGHSDLTTTEIYLKQLDDSEVDDAMDEVY